MRCRAAEPSAIRSHCFSFSRFCKPRQHLPAFTLKPANVPAHHEPHRLGRLCGRHLDHRQLCASGLAHLPHPRCERHFAEHVQLVHGGRGALVGLRHLDGGLAHHHCQHYHHQFGIDDFADEATLPLKIECIGATCPTFLSRIGDWGGSNLDANSLQSGSVLDAIQQPGLPTPSLAKRRTIRILGKKSPHAKYCFTNTSKCLHNPSYQNDRS